MFFKKIITDITLYTANNQHFNSLNKKIKTKKNNTFVNNIEAL